LRMKSGTKLLVLTLAAAACLAAHGALAGVRAQEKTAAAAAQERDRGIGLYERGDFKAAVKALRAAVKLDKEDGEAWHYLGLALNRGGETKEARKAAEKAVRLRPDFAPARAALAYLLLLSNKLPDALRVAEAALALDPQNAEAHYVTSVIHLNRFEPERALEEIEAALKAKPDFAAAHLFKSQALLGLMARANSRPPSGPPTPGGRAQAKARNKSLYAQAAESLERFFALSPAPPDAEVWREQLATLRLFAESVGREASDPDRAILPMSELTTKARILTRPEPAYTAEALKSNVAGMVVLQAVFAADGTVKNVLVLRALPYGLTQRSVAAARRIKFEPATKDGRPVSQFIQIEYNFNLY
jgi:TonB family protein